MKATHGIFKESNSTPIFVGDFPTVKRSFEALRASFFFAAGTAKARTDEFPYTIKPL